VEKHTKTPHIVVLMSAYNGARFIREQIESILRQEGVSVRLLVRDDGSSDATRQILGNLQKVYPEIELVFDTNVGVSASFFRLLEKSGTGYDFYAFADQDDVWKPDKLIRACKMLGSVDSTAPKMYYSRLEFVDENLRRLGYSAIPSTRGFHNALVQNQATGCTIVLNRSARNLVCQHLPEWTLMHDWWCYLVISAFGEVVYDEYPGILYRKHGNNVTPATPNFAMELYARTRRFLGKGDIPEKVTDQARQFFSLYGDKLSAENRRLTQGFLKVREKGPIARLVYALNMPVQRNTPLDNLIMRILIIAGRF